MSLNEAIKDFLSLELYQEHDKRLNYTSVISKVFTLLTEIAELDEQRKDRKEILSLLKETRDIVGKSPFFNRLQTWPRGYPGDFETIEYLIQGENKAMPGTIEYYLEEYGLKSPAAQQHRNKVARQSELILQSYLLNQNGCASKILSLACGSCPDIQQVQKLIEPSKCSFFLVDYDNDALEFSRSKLSDFNGACKFVKRNVLRLLNEPVESGPFDLIIIGGLFDYLSDRSIIRILERVWRLLLAPRGKLFFTNISPDNPDRIWIEYLADWVLISRSEGELREMCTNAGIPEECMTIDKDSTQITYMIEIQK